MINLYKEIQLTIEEAEAVTKRLDQKEMTEGDKLILISLLNVLRTSTLSNKFFPMPDTKLPCIIRCIRFMKNRTNEMVLEKHMITLDQIMDKLEEKIPIQAAFCC